MDGENIKRLRAILGLTQKELADKIGVSVNTIQNYEKGGVIPAARQQLFVTLEELAISKIEVDTITTDGKGNFVAKEVGTNKGVVKGSMVPITNNTGSVNTGTVGGHNVNISDPNVKKIIEADRIAIERDTSIAVYEKEIEALKARIKDLERVIDTKDELIELLRTKAK